MPTVKAVVYEARNTVAIRDVELAPLGERQIRVNTLYTFVSPGTELRVLSGHYGAEGRYPLIPGYATVCEVIEIGAGVRDFRVGDLISGRNPVAVPGLRSQWGGQAGGHIYPTTGEDRPVLLPHGANPLDYVITEVSAISLRGVDAAAPRSGESAVVLGQGLIGAFSAAWLQVFGCRVTVADVDDRRLDRALRRGVAAAVNMKESGAVERLATLGNGGFDIVVEASGTSSGALAAYKLARKKPQSYGAEYKVEPIRFYHQDWPRLIMQANYLEPVSIDPFGFMPGEGMTILTPKDRGVEDRQKAAELIRTGRIRSKDFIDLCVTPDAMPDAYAKLASREAFSVTCRWS